MKTYARISNSVVVELVHTALKIADMFHAGLDWRDVTDVMTTVQVQPGSDSDTASLAAPAAVGSVAGASAEPPAVAASRAVRVGDVVRGSAFAAPAVLPAPVIPTIAQLNKQMARVEARLLKLEESRS